MRRLETKLNGPILVELVKHGDDRGFFAETYRQDKFAEIGIPAEWVQDNHSRSAQNVVRGMHLQLGDGVAKLVRCGHGAIYDAVVDLRKGSPTYGQAEGFELTEDNMRVVYCPVGFGHGFCTLSEVANDDLQAERLLRDRSGDRAQLQGPGDRDRVADPGRGAAGFREGRGGAHPERARAEARGPAVRVLTNRTLTAYNVQGPTRRLRRGVRLGRRPGRDRQRGGRRGRGRVADVQRPLGGREDEVVDEAAVAGHRLGAHPGEGGHHVGGADLREVAGGGRDEGSAGMPALSPAPVRHQRRNMRHEPGQASVRPSRRRLRAAAVGPIRTSPSMCLVRWTPRKGSEGSGTG